MENQTLKALKDLNIEQKKADIMESIMSLVDPLGEIKQNNFSELNEEEAQEIYKYSRDLIHLLNDITMQNVMVPLTSISVKVSGRMSEIAARDNIEKSAQMGYTIGSLHYIDRQDGIYVVDRIDRQHIIFKYCLPDRSTRWSKNKAFDLNQIDRRMQPLRTVGPFRVGAVVVRDGREYTVRGYLGYRMVIERADSLNNYQYEGLREYTIVSKKDESTYRSIMI